MNKNFRIYYKEGMRDKVLTYLKNYSNDILINTVDDESIGITIENENETEFFNNLLDKLKTEVYSKN